MNMDAAPIQGFAAQLLERGASGYAGFAAAALLDRDPAVHQIFATDAMGGLKRHLTQSILELSAALSAAEPRLFVARVIWIAKAFRARNLDPAGIRLGLESLRQVLGERLPEAARAEPLDYIDQALEALQRAPLPADGPELDPARPTDRLALIYLQQVLEGNVAGAVAGVVGATRTGLDVRSAYLDVLLPAQREIGRLWHRGEVNVAEEHLVSFTTQRTMAVLASSATLMPANGKTAIVAAVAANTHDLGLRAVADLYQMAGWRAIFLGADVPTEDLPKVLEYFQADLLLLGATMSTQLPTVKQTIAAVRDRTERKVTVIVGGAAFEDAPELWRKLGADGYASRIDEAVALGGRLVGA